MTTFNDRLLQMGGVPVGMDMLGLAGGDVFFLDPANGNDSNTGKTPAEAFKTLPIAYAALTDNHNDVLVYIAGTGSISLSVAFEWAKNYTHFLGVCSPTRVGQRARIFQAAGAVNLSPLFLISGSGCVFSNLYIFQGVADTGSLIDVEVTGFRNYFKNVHFAGGGHTTQAIDGGVSLCIAGGRENVFEDCTMGVDTVVAGAGVAAMNYAATGGAARNFFKNCNFTLHAGAAGCMFIELLGNAGLDRYQIFEKCRFINLAAQQMTSAIVVAAGFDKNNKRLLMDADCSMIGAPDWETGDTGVVYIASGDRTVVGNAGIYAASDVS